MPLLPPRSTESGARHPGPEGRGSSRHPRAALLPRRRESPTPPALRNASARHLPAPGAPEHSHSLTSGKSSLRRPDAAPARRSPSVGRGPGAASPGSAEPNPRRRGAGRARGGPGRAASTVPPERFHALHPEAGVAPRLPLPPSRTHPSPRAPGSTPRSRPRADRRASEPAQAQTLTDPRSRGVRDALARSEPDHVRETPPPPRPSLKRRESGDADLLPESARRRGQAAGHPSRVSGGPGLCPPERRSLGTGRGPRGARNGQRFLWCAAAGARVGMAVETCGRLPGPPL